MAALEPCTHMGTWKELLASATPATVAILEENQQMDNISLCNFLFKQKENKSLKTENSRFTKEQRQKDLVTELKVTDPEEHGHGRLQDEVRTPLH